MKRQLLAAILTISLAGVTTAMANTVAIYVENSTQDTFSTSVGGFNKTLVPGLNVLYTGSVTPFSKDFWVQYCVTKEGTQLCNDGMIVIQYGNYPGISNPLEITPVLNLGTSFDIVGSEANQGGNCIETDTNGAICNAAADPVYTLTLSS